MHMHYQIKSVQGAYLVCWLAQTEAEHTAWELAKEANIDLVTICPNFVLGPVLSRRTSGTSIGYMKVRLMDSSKRPTSSHMVH